MYRAQTIRIPILTLTDVFEFGCFSSWLFISVYLCGSITDMQSAESRICNEYGEIQFFSESILKQHSHMYIVAVFIPPVQTEKTSLAKM